MSKRAREVLTQELFPPTPITLTDANGQSFQLNANFDIIRNFLFWKQRATSGKHPVTRAIVNEFCQKVLTSDVTSIGFSYQVNVDFLRDIVKIKNELHEVGLTAFETSTAFYPANMNSKQESNMMYKELYIEFID